MTPDLSVTRVNSSVIAGEASIEPSVQRLEEERGRYLETVGRELRGGSVSLRPAPLQTM